MVAKRKDQFEVMFLDLKGKSIGELNALQEFLLAVDLGTEVISEAELIHKTNSIILWFQDDINSQVHQTIRSWIDRGNEQFKLIIKPRNDVYAFSFAQFSVIQHSIFSREDCYQTIKGIDGHHKVGQRDLQFSAVLSPPSNNNSATKLVQIAFSEMLFCVAQ